MSGFDNDWACPNPNYRREDGRLLPCPEGGCAKGCCARETQDYIERLTGVRPTLEQVHVG